MSWRTDLHIPAGLESSQPEPPQGRRCPQVQGNHAQPPTDVEYSDAVEEISSSTLFRCWLSHSSLATSASSNRQTYPSWIGSSVDNLEKQSASRMMPQYAPKGCFYGNKSNLSNPKHSKNIKPFVKNSTNSGEGRGQQEEAESEILVIGEEVHSENRPNTHSGPLNSNGLQLIDLLASSSSDSSLSPTNYEPDSKLIALSGVTEDTGLKIESVFSFSDYRFIPGKLQQTTPHWMDSDSKTNDGFSGDSGSDDPSTRDILSYKETANSPVTHLQMPAQQSPHDRPQPMDSPRHCSHSYRCSVCQKTFRSLSTLQFHMSYSKTHNPSFTQYPKKESPFSESPTHSCQGQAAAPQDRRSNPALLISPTPRPISSKESLPVDLQPLSSSGINSASSVVCSGDTGLPKGSVGPFSKSHATPVESQHAATDWLHGDPKENDKELIETLTGQSDPASSPDVPLEASLRQMPTEQTAPGQTSTQQCAEGASTSTAPRPTGIPKYCSKSYWCSACGNLFRSLGTLQVHVKHCKPRSVSRWMRLSRCRLPASEQRRAAVGKRPGPTEGAPALCPARFVPMSRHFYLALADGHNYHVCNICDLWCNDEKSLGFHLKVHFWKRNHLCRLCDRAFHTHKACRRHQAKHSSHPRYRCSKCGRVFSSYKTLKQHMRNLHEVDLGLSDNDTYEEVRSKAATYRMI